MSVPQTPNRPDGAEEALLRMAEEVAAMACLRPSRGFQAVVVARIRAAAVLAASPAVTGEDERALRVSLQGLVDAWGKRSAPNGSSAYQDCRTDLRDLLAAPAPAVTAPTDEEQT